MLLREQRYLAAAANVHRRIEAGVLAAGTALGRNLVVELVLDLHLARFADLGEVQGDDQFPDFAVVNNACGDFGKGVADLAGEGAAVQLLEELGGIGCDGYG